MEQRQSTGGRAGKIARILVTIPVALALSACSAEPDSAPTKPGASCLPARLKPVAKPASGYQVFLDRSFSMNGYVQPGLGPVALADILNLLKSTSEARKLPVTYSAFGKKIEKLVSADAAQAFARPTAYSCAGRSGCDNQESLIDQTLASIAADGGDQLSIVVTDLWLDNKSFRGTLDVALGNPLRKLLQDGKAIGVLGIDAPYAGRVYDVPTVGQYDGATRRPLFVLLIGSVDEVTAAYKLFASQSPLMRGDSAHFALFTAAPIAATVTPQLAVSGGGVARGAVFRDEERTLEFSMNVSTATTQQGAIRGNVAGTTDGGTELRPGLQWAGQLSATSRWWRLADGADLQACSPNMWLPAARFPNPWKRIPGNDMAAAFMLDDRAKEHLLVPGRYFMLGELSIAGLYPNPASDWMKEWSLDDDEATVRAFIAGRPTRFKALKLASIAALMDQELIALEQRPRVFLRFPLVLTMQP